MKRGDTIIVKSGPYRGRKGKVRDVNLHGVAFVAIEGNEGVLTAMAVKRIEKEPTPRVFVVTAYGDCVMRSQYLHDMLLVGRARRQVTL